MEGSRDFLVSECKSQIRWRRKILKSEEKSDEFEELWWSSCGHVSIKREEGEKHKKSLLN